MKILHLADLHIGKILYGYSMAQEHLHFFKQVYKIIETEAVDVVVLAGDIYDRAVPSVEAVNLLNAFLGNLINTYHVKVLMISGNHDSPSRLDFGSTILQAQGLYIESHFKPTIAYVDIDDVRFYLLPFFSKHDLRNCLQNNDRNLTYDDLFALYIQNQDFNIEKKKVMITHTTVLQSIHEAIGGVESIGAYHFKDFTYTALGHLHECHPCAANVYYSGSCMKLSKDEGEKYALMIDLDDQVTIQKFALTPLHDVVGIEDTFEHIIQGAGSEDYVFITLLDKTIQINAADRLKTIYPRLLGLTYKQMESQKEHRSLNQTNAKTPQHLFEDFYTHCYGESVNEKQVKLFNRFFKEVSSRED